MWLISSPLYLYWNLFGSTDTAEPIQYEIVAS